MGAAGRRARLTALTFDGWQVQVVAETGSTNSDLAAAARSGAPAGSVLVAEQQTAGRGRLDRRWVAPPGTGLTFSVLLRPDVPAGSLSWLPMVVGAALVEPLRTQFGLAAVLKWPNDVLVEERKLAGVLVEVVPAPGQRSAVVVGIGLNVAAGRDELPPGATSVSAELPADVESADRTTEGRTTADRTTADRTDVDRTDVDRTTVLVALLGGLRDGQRRWEADPSSARQTYLPLCSSVGRW
nr:biotin--[acetyl-CoA-carboxylase] ligase [Micromonospora sp. DSM 115978]